MAKVDLHQQVNQRVNSRRTAQVLSADVVEVGHGIVLQTNVSAFISV